MSSYPASGMTPREIIRILWDYRKWWITTTAACVVVSVVYALVMTRYWEATQGLVVRQEVSSVPGEQPGKFASLYDMRTMQETILELAKSRHVVVATLNQVGTGEGEIAGETDDEAIDKFRQRLKMLPPNGAEFGQTEVFYFTFRDPSRERAIAVVTALCDQLDIRLGQLRDERAQSIIAELEKRVELARTAHTDQSRRLNEFEASVGADLGELRMLHSAASGQSDLRQQLVQLESEARQYEVRADEAKKLLDLLQSAEKNTERLIALPNSLLESQPALRRLKDGLVDAQLRTARLSGTRSSEHPHVKAAVASEERIRSDFRRELETAVASAKVDVELFHRRYENATSELHDVQSRLDNLADLRTEYSNYLAAVESSRAVLDHARQSLGEVRATQAAAHSASLVSRIDTPETGPYPVGTGRTMVVALGMVFGVILGLGLVFLVAEPAINAPRTPSAAAAASPVDDHIEPFVSGIPSASEVEFASPAVPLSFPQSPALHAGGHTVN